MSFQHAGAALSTSNAAAPVNLELAGTDGVFYPEDATIPGATIIISSASVPASAEVSYG